MTGFTKISNVILVVFVLSFLSFTFLTFFQIQNNIIEEATASLAQAQEMVHQKLSVEEIELILAHSPHLTVERFSGKLASANPEDFQYTQFWQKIFVQQVRPIIFPMGENVYLIISPNEHTEFVQNLNFFWLVLGLFVTTSGLLLLTMKLAIKHQLKPLNRVIQALKKLSEGTHCNDFAKGELSEIQEVVVQFNDLQRTLEDRQTQLVEVDNELAILQEQERSYLAQELHDNVGQLLTTVKAHAYILTNTSDLTVLSDSGQKVQMYCQQISDAIRQLTTHLHPLSLDQVSLEEALCELISAQQTANPSVNWNVQMDLKGYISERQRDIHLYRFVQEALTNISKHAKATQIDVLFARKGAQLNMHIVDNGVGYDEDVKESIGMFSMRNRARCLGAELELSVAPNQGVSIYLSLAIEPKNQEVA